MLPQPRQHVGVTEHNEPCRMSNSKSISLVRDAGWSTVRPSQYNRCSRASKHEGHRFDPVTQQQLDLVLRSLISWLQNPMPMHFRIAWAMTCSNARRCATLVGVTKIVLSRATSKVLSLVCDAGWCYHDRGTGTWQNSSKSHLLQ